MADHARKLGIEVGKNDPPGKVLMRDFIDSRRSIAGYSMPILMVTLAFSLLVSSFSADAAYLVTWFTYAIFALIGVYVFFGATAA